MATKKISELEAITTAEDSDVLVIVDVSEGTTNKITKGNLLLGSGHSIEMEIDSSYQLVLKLKNTEGTILSTQSIDLPNENAITGIEYDNGNLILTKQSGSTAPVDISGLIDGLLAESTFETFTEQLQEVIDEINEKDETQDELIEKNYKDITKEKEVIEQLKENSLKATVPTATSINVKDSADVEMIRFDLSGHSEQETTQGYNIINIADISRTVSGVTITSTGTKFKLNGTATAGINFDILPIVEKTINGNYTLSLTYLSGTVSGGTNFSVRDVSTSASLSYVGFGTSNATRTSEYANNSIKYKIYADSGSVFTNYEFEIQLEEGSTAHDYEPFTYGASPNPNYEQPIKSCGENVNLFDKNSDLVYSNLVTKTVLETGIRLTNNGSMQGQGLNTVARYKVMDLTGYEGKKIIVKTNAKSSANNRSFLYLRIGNNNNYFIDTYPLVPSGTTLDGVLSVTLTVPDTLDEAYHYLYMTLYGTREATTITQGDYIDYTNLKIEVDSDTPYSPYGMGSITENITTKNFLKIKPGTYQDARQEITAIVNEDGTMRIAGTTSVVAHLYIPLDKDVILLPNDYCWSSRNEGTLPSYTTALRVLTTNSAIDANSFSNTFLSIFRNETNYKNATITEKTTYKYFYIYVAANTTVDFTINTQIELGSTKTDIVEHKEQIRTIYTQQPFRSIGEVEDCFVKKSDSWYERHYILELDLSEVTFRKCQSDEENVAFANLSNTSICNYESDLLAFLSEYFTWKGRAVGYAAALNSGVGLYSYIESGNKYLYFVVPLSVATNIAEFNNWISNNNVKVQYIAVTPLDLPCIQEQIDILENLPSTYKNETNVFSLDEVQAYIDMEYIKDTELAMADYVKDTDLEDYVKNTDYAASNKGGVVKINTNAGTNIDSSGNLVSREKTYEVYSTSSNSMFVSKGTLENVITGKGLTTKDYVDGLVGDLEDILEELDIGGGVE